MTMTRVALTLALLAAGLMPAHGTDKPPFALDSTTMRKLTRVPPFRAEFPSGTTFRVPDNLRFVTPDKLEEFCERMKMTNHGDEVGAVIPQEQTWFTVFYELKDDPLKDQADRSNPDKAALMEWQEKFLANHTPRSAGAAKAWRIVNWTHPPSYDAEKKILTMGVRVTSDSSSIRELMSFQQILYGPQDEILCLQTIAPISSWEKPVQQAQKLTEEVNFPEAHGDVSPTEEMMYYAQLIGGGLLGAILVVVGARMLMGGGRKQAPQRRVGLPR